MYVCKYMCIHTHVTNITNPRLKKSMVMCTEYEGLCITFMISLVVIFPYQTPDEL